MRTTRGLPVTWPAALLLSALSAALPARRLAAEVVVGMDKEIFANPEAADMVRQARSFDPARSRPGNCQKAIECYEKAIALQPGAKINAVLCNRIAELYAYAGAGGFGWTERRAKAIAWWRRCVELTNPHQSVWIKAQMGLGCTTFLVKKAQEGIESYQAVLAIDPEQMEVPDWRVAPDPNTEHGRRQRQGQLAVIRKLAQQSRLKAVEMIHYVMMRSDRKATVATLLKIAKQHKGTPIGKRAAELVDDALKRTGKRL